MSTQNLGLVNENEEDIKRRVFVINLICCFGLNFLLIIFALIQWILVRREKYQNEKEDSDTNIESISHSEKINSIEGILSSEGKDFKKQTLIPSQQDSDQ